MRLTKLMLGVLALGVWAGAGNLYAQQQTIAGNESSLTVRVFKSGLFSGFAHDHEIQAPIETGSIDSDKPSVQLRVDARKMRVLDPESSAEDRAKIQQTMQGAGVLNVEKFPEISYESTSVTDKGQGHWEVHGTLSLHGKKEPVVVEVSLQGGHYRGSAALKQSAFGIEPIRIAGGTVKVKDEVKVEFDIVGVK